MRWTTFGWLVAATITALAALPTPTLPQDLPPTEPILRIETGMHTGNITSIGVEASCRLMVTGSYDKTARVWALTENGTDAPELRRVLRVPIGPGKGGEIFAVALSPDGRIVAAGGWDVFAEQAGDAIYIFDVAEGNVHRFCDWPNPEVPRFGAGVYTIWHRDGRFIYVGMSGRGITAATIARNSPHGLYTRLHSHWTGRRSGDQFCIYVADRFVLPTLNHDDIRLHCFRPS